MQMTGAKSPDELMQLAQANPQMAQQMLSRLAIGEGDAPWLDQAASKQAAPGARPELEQSYTGTSGRSDTFDDRFSTWGSAPSGRYE